MSEGVNRGIALGNRILKECRDHLRKHRGEPTVTSDPLFALSYVMAEFIAAASRTDEDIAEGVRINSDIVTERARQALPSVINRRRGRMN